MFIELLIILWITTGIFTAIWQHGRVHGYHIAEFPNSNTLQFGFFEALVAIVTPPVAVFATSITYGKVPGYKWTWPKKGVTYQ
jgi:hypothetical protein